ncbi:hypothetical protein [Natrinema caseinilyticum]|uniref:phage NrS-1 polymerase family protein n=1 Tax=Natrinema caseinilyticum TaxID=2961570 RepID=UPI0020C29266|nr:hypothetical protein [Natrinema caseinilyticum]
MSIENSIDTAALPSGLRERNQWVCWREENRDGKPTKIPVSPSSGGFASSTDSDTWASFETALEYADTENADGIGFVFSDDDPIVGVDLDDCRDPETEDVNEIASDIIERLDSYTEISPSGTGYHVLIEGELPDGRNRRGSIELYDTARFFTVTGDHLEETPPRVARRQDALVAIHREYVQETDTDSGSESGSRGPANDQSQSTGTVDLEDEDLLEKARNASNGEKFERLWRGSTAGYDSHSEADMALCCLLAFWTGGNQTRINRLFRQSGLLREKWDEVHYADGSTYGEKTVERAIANTSEFYDPDAGESSTEISKDQNESSTTDGRDETKQNHAYLVEKNRLLKDRINDLEATVERKTERITELEEEIERLKVELEDSNRDTDASPGERAVTPKEGKHESKATSVWGRTKRLFGNGPE